jgi:hypothetical protein
VKEACVAKKDDEIGMDRRGFLQCMAWVGTGAAWTMSSGVLKGLPLGQAGRAAMAKGAGADGLRFVQISDSHIGFDKPANTDVTATPIARCITLCEQGGVGVASLRNLSPPHVGKMQRGNRLITSGKRTDLDVPEGDGELLVLKPEVSFRESRIVNIERRLAIQDDHDVIPLRRDLIMIPLIRIEPVIPRGFRNAHDSAGVVASRLLFPNLHLVAARFLAGNGRTHRCWHPRHT